MGSTTIDAFIELDGLGLADFFQKIGLKKKKIDSFHPVTIRTTAPDREVLSKLLCQMRAWNRSVMIILKPDARKLDNKERYELIALLAEWNQLLLCNVLTLCGDYLPEVYYPVFQQEAKFEEKWFYEWQQAAHDPRIFKYPSLPWRSFLRKVNGENVEFAQVLMAKNIDPGYLKSFLQNKKKVICLFPKNWKKEV